MSSEIAVDLPAKTRRNGTLFLHVILADNDGPLDWRRLQRDGPTVIQRIALTDYMVPKAKAFNLLGDDDDTASRRVTDEPASAAAPKRRPVTHFKTHIYVSILSDYVSMSVADIPPELAQLIRVNRANEFLPIVQNDFLKTRLADLVEVQPDAVAGSEPVTFHFHYAPIGIGKLRLMLHVEQALHQLRRLGFAKKDVDEVKGIFSDTNVYLLCGTIFVGSVHVLFDFLSFKHDVAFWRGKRTYAGLSLRTTLWRAFSQIVIFLYLVDEHTSLLVLVPAGIGTLIELWKCKKILRIEWVRSDVGGGGIAGTGWCLRRAVDEPSASVRRAESRTQAVDREAMRYLSWVLYPLCAAGAVYSLLYQPHKSWRSWTLTSLVNGVYAFGFLFMLPQLFINYKLKSVAALPWRAFMYKAFNTFIDDVFAFIITMPTAHRLACFRDDIVFIVYLYQRWLYPVDATRVDDGRAVVEFEEEPETEATLADVGDEKKTK